MSGEYYDEFGLRHVRAGSRLDSALRALVADMFQPCRCAHCGKIYDLGKVTVTARYLDCSMWKAPCCGTPVDDRGETGWNSRKDYERLPGGKFGGAS